MSWKPKFMKATRPLFIALLLLYTLWALKPSASQSEAWWLWVVRDVVDVQPAAPTDVLRGARDNLSSAIDRSEGGLNLPTAVAVEGWTWLVGDSLEALRWSGVLLMGLAAAIAIRVVERRNCQLAILALQVLVVIMPVLWFIESSDRTAEQLAYFQSQRAHADPVLTFFTESSPLGYYQYRYDIRAGLGLDLGWREFTPAELTNIASKLDSTRPIWLIAPTSEHPAMNTIRQNLTDAGREVIHGGSTMDEIAFFHFR